MTERDIQKAVRGLLANNDYHLFNQYIFRRNWESDYFSVTKAGLLIEVEVKISRSDFFADFKKRKHLFYQAAWDKKKFIVENKGPNNWKGDPICKYRIGDLHIGDRWSWRKHCNHWMHTSFMTHRVVTVVAPTTSIRIHEINKQFLPHRFYFAVPKGMIQPDEVPAYAGLIELHESGIADYTKKAPVLHKQPNPPGLWKTILDKYYFKHRELITKP